MTQQSMSSFASVWFPPHEAAHSLTQTSGETQQRRKITMLNGNSRKVCILAGDTLAGSDSSGFASTRAGWKGYDASRRRSTKAKGAYSPPACLYLK